MRIYAFIVTFLTVLWSSFAPAQNAGAGSMMTGQEIKLTTYAAGCGGVEGGNASSFGGDPKAKSLNLDNMNPASSWVMVAVTQQGGTEALKGCKFKLDAIPNIEFRGCDHYATTENGDSKVDISVADCSQKDNPGGRVPASSRVEVIECADPKTMCSAD